MPSREMAGMVYSTLQTPITGGAIRGCSAIQMPVKRPIMPDMAMAVRARPMWASSNPANQSARWAYRPKIPCSSFMSRLRVQAAHCVCRTGLRAAAALEAVRPVDDIGRSGSDALLGTG